MCTKLHPPIIFSLHFLCLWIQIPQITRKLSDWVMAPLNEFLGHDHEQRLHFQGSHSQGTYHIINDFRIRGKVWKKIDVGTSLILLSFARIPHLSFIYMAMKLWRMGFKSTQRPFSGLWKWSRVPANLGEMWRAETWNLFSVIGNLGSRNRNSKTWCKAFKQGLTWPDSILKKSIFVSNANSVCRQVSRLK